MRIVTASLDHTAQVWNAKSGQAIGFPLEHRSSVDDDFPVPILRPIKSAAFSPDGTRIVTAGFDARARVWDAQSGLPIGFPLKHEDVVTSAVFSPDGTRIVTASEDKTVRVWDARTSQAIGAPLKHKTSVPSAVFSPDGTWIVTVSLDQTAQVWDAKTSQAVGSPLKHEGAVTSAVFSPDGTRIVTASRDKTARVWDAKSGQAIGSPLKHGDEVRSAVFSPDGTRIVTVSEDKTARVWDAKTGQVIGSALKHEDVVTSAVFSPDGTWIVTASEDKTARVWDAKSGQAIGSPLKHKSSVRSAAFSPDGTRIVTTSLFSSARVWDVKARLPLATEFAECLTAYCSGSKLDPELGVLQQLTIAERMALREGLTPFLSTSEDWAFVAPEPLPHDSQSALVSPRMTMTLRESTTRFIGTMEIQNIRDAAATDPTNPLLPFGQAVIESSSQDDQSSNLIRAAWLCEYGLKHLPADVNATDLRLAAKLVAAVSESIPEQRTTAILLLDRARDKEPEDDKTKRLRVKLLIGLEVKLAIGELGEVAKEKAKITYNEDGTVNLTLSWTDISDLSTLAALPLKSLKLRDCKNVTDLRALGKCSTLRILDLSLTNVRDLRGLEGLKLTRIACPDTMVSDLTPLRGMPLEWVFFEETLVKDISPLLDSPEIEHIGLSESVTNVELLRKLPGIKFISTRIDFANQRPAQTAEEFWAEVEQRKQ